MNPLHDCPPPRLPEALAYAYRRLHAGLTAVVIFPAEGWTPGAPVVHGDPGPSVAWAQYPRHKLPADAVSRNADERARYIVRTAIMLRRHVTETA